MMSAAIIIQAKTGRFMEISEIDMIFMLAL